MYKQLHTDLLSEQNSHTLSESVNAHSYENRFDGKPLRVTNTFILLLFFFLPKTDNIRVELKHLQK